MPKNYPFFHFISVTVFSIFMISTTCNAKSVQIEQSMLAGSTKWTSAFDINIATKEIRVNVTVSLLAPKGIKGPELEEKTKLWSEAINDTWNNRFYVSVDGKEIPITIKVKFSHHKPHHRVVIHPGRWSPNQHNWYINTPPKVISHEIGHMLGAYDEYRGGALFPDEPTIDTTSIMGSKPLKGAAYPRHLLLLENKLGKLLVNDQIRIMRY